MALHERFEINFGVQYGEGGYGKTYAARDKNTGDALAVKIVDSRRMKMESIQKENHIMEVLNHPNIISVKAHGHYDAAQPHLYHTFMELASGGELFDQVIDRGANAMPEPVALGFFSQMIEAVGYCHLAGVAHRDLKLENVLLNKQGAIKVIDFGLSHVYPRTADGKPDRSKPLHDVCGSKSYAAPEVLNKRGYDGFAADLWSLGVCLFAMLSGFFPLDEASPNDWRFGKLKDSQQSGRQSTVAAVYGWYKRSARHLSPEAIHLMDKLLTINVENRITMAQLREHPWMRNTTFAAQQDQGSFNASQIVGDDTVTYRGLGGIDASIYSQGDAMPIDDEDELPVYRSLGEPSMASAEPMGPMPGLARQKGRLNLLEVESPA